MSRPEQGRAPKHAVSILSPVSRRSTDEATVSEERGGLDALIDQIGEIEDHIAPLQIEDAFSRRAKIGEILHLHGHSTASIIVSTSMLLRSLSAASQSFASKPMFAELLEDEFLDCPSDI